MARAREVEVTMSVTSDGSSTCDISRTFPLPGGPEDESLMAELLMATAAAMAAAMGGAVLEHFQSRVVR